MHDGHSHGGHGQTATGRDEAVALLTYMLSHNRHHADELHDAAHALPETDAAAREALHEALSLLHASNDRLESALGLLNGKAE